MIKMPETPRKHITNELSQYCAPCKYENRASCYSLYAEKLKRDTRGSLK